MKSYLRAFLLFFLISSAAYAQQMKVNGVVISAEDNEPIIGASVTVKGNTSIGTVTDLDGKFQLNVPSGTKTIVVSYIGMKTQELAPKTSLMKIVLSTDAQELGEVVVTGMQQMDKRLFTGASTKVDAEKAKLDGMADISRSLEGRAAGVSVQNVSGTFGTAPKIRVRGATSIYGSSKPLWVVDGVIMEDAVEMSADDLSSGDATTLISSAIAGLSPDDIESFQILKDGSATSIYGARAMAGVVVITTKKGKAGVSSVSYTGEFTMRMKPHYSEFNMMNSQDQMEVYQEMNQKGWLNFAETYRKADSGIYGKMYQLINSYQNGKFGLDNTIEGRNAYLQLAELRNTNWFDELFNLNLMQNHAVSISSGTEKARFYASMSALIDPGWYKQSKVNRYTANFNTSFSLSKHLTLNLLGNASYRKQKAPGTLSANVDAVSGEVKRDFDINPYSFALNTSRALDAKEYYTRNYAPFNIFDELENNNMELDVVDMKYQGELNWKPVRGLEIKALGAVRYQLTSQRHDIMDNSNQASAYRAAGDATIRDANPLLYKDPDILNSLPIIVLPQGGIMDKREYKMLSYDFRGTAAYNTVFKDKHIMNLFAGMEINSTDRNQFWSRGYGLQYTKGNTPFFDYNMFKQLAEQNSDYFTDEFTKVRSVAFFGMGTYSYMGKYTVNGTIRYEGTNRMGKSRTARWLPTWNVSGAWNAHEESWFENLKPVLSHATLKASYSLTGERGPAWVTNSEAIFVQSTPWRPSSNDKESGIKLDAPANPDLTYEKKHEFNIGAELGFLDNRINFAIDGYWRNNYDLIGIINTAGITGAVLQYANVASMKGHGVEFTLSTKNIVTKDFTWATDFIFSNARTKVNELYAVNSIMDYVSGTGFTKIGDPARSIYSIPFRGLNEEGLPTFTGEDGETTVTGINFQSRNTDFLKYEGPTEAPITGSFGNIFNYKKWSLNVFITYSFGNVVRLDPIFSNEYSDLDATPKEFKNRWSIPGDEKITNIPVIASKRQNQRYANLDYAYNAYNYSDVRIAKGDFIRLKEISLNYDFSDQAWIKKLKLNGLQMKLQATNLWLLYADSKLNGQDPEFFSTGGVAAPVPKQFTFTLRFNL